MRLLTFEQWGDGNTEIKWFDPGHQGNWRNYYGQNSYLSDVSFSWQPVFQLRQGFLYSWSNLKLWFLFCWKINCFIKIILNLWEYYMKWQYTLVSGFSLGHREGMARPLFFQSKCWSQEDPQAILLIPSSWKKTSLWIHCIQKRTRQTYFSQ